MLNLVDNFSKFTIDTTNRFSPSIWGDCPVSALQANPDLGVYLRYDNVRSPVLVTPTITTEANYGDGLKAFGSSGGTLLPAKQENGGGYILTETDDNEGIGFATIQLPFKIYPTKGKLWFEARLKNSVVTDTENGFVVGLWEQQTMSATVPIAAAGTLADANFVGFHRLEGDGDQINTVYKANGVTQATVKEDAISTTANVHTVAGALAADTFIKLGMVFNPLNARMEWYINGVLLPDYYTVTTTAGNPFPNDVQLGICIFMLLASANDSILTVDHVTCAQLSAP